jgi:nucleoside-diphosphate-sugar epimerase
MVLHAIIGAGPVGSSIARRLAAQGDQVRVLTRSGRGPSHPGIELITGDAHAAADLARAAAGAATLFNCVNPPYTKWKTEWPLISAAFISAAERTGARLVTTGNLYGYGPDSGPMRADSPLRATGVKGAARATMWRDAQTAHEAGRILATEVRAGDFFGPHVVDAAMGERVVPKILVGKKVQMLGGVDLPHSWGYMPDVARTMVAVAADESAFGRAWIVPALTISQRELVSALASAAGVNAPKIAVVGRQMLSALGLVVPQMRELKETLYQFSEPFIVDAAETTQRFGLEPTSLAEAAAATIEWYRQRTS